MLSLDGLSVNVYILVFFENMQRKVNFHIRSDKNNSTLYADRYTLLVTPRSVLLRMRNVSDKSCRDNQNTHFVFNNIFTKIVILLI